MIWSDDNGKTWYSAIPVSEYRYSKTDLGPFDTKAEAIAAMDAAWEAHTSLKKRG